MYEMILALSRPFNEMMSLAAFAIGIALMFAFWRATRAAEGASRHFAQAIFWITGSYIWRAFYWDVLRSLIPSDIWAQWVNVSGGLFINTAWSAAFTYGVYHALRGLSESIPAADRAAYPWWRAWLYPPMGDGIARGLLRGVRTVIRAQWRRDRR